MPDGRHPLEQAAGLHLKELAQGIQRIGMQASEAAVTAGQPVRTGVAQGAPPAEGVGGDATAGHELTDLEADHKVLRVGGRPRRRDYCLAVYSTAVYSACSAI